MKSPRLARLMAPWPSPREEPPSRSGPEPDRRSTPQCTAGRRRPPVGTRPDTGSG